MKKLNALKLESDILCYGCTVWIDNSTPEKVLSFSREYGGKKIVFIGNISNETALVTIGEGLTGTELLSNGVSAITADSVELEPRGYIVLEK